MWKGLEVFAYGGRDDRLFDCISILIFIGEGIIFMICGLLFGFYENSILLFLSLVFTAAASVVLIITKHVGRKYTLPFAPFVFAGFGVMCIWKVFG